MLWLTQHFIDDFRRAKERYQREAAEAFEEAKEIIFECIEVTDANIEVYVKNAQLEYQLLEELEAQLLELGRSMAANRAARRAVITVLNDQRHGSDIEGATMRARPNIRKAGGRWKCMRWRWYTTWKESNDVEAEIYQSLSEVTGVSARFLTHANTTLERIGSQDGAEGKVAEVRRVLREAGVSVTDMVGVAEDGHRFYGVNEVADRWACGVDSEAKLNEMAEPYSGEPRK